MSSVNRTILVGNLGQDPELKHLEGGRAMARFSIATSERWRDKDGALQERTEWHRVVAWGKLAEVVGQYMKKGRQVYVEGRLQTRKWKDREGNDRTTTEIVAETVTFLGGRKSGEASEAEAAPSGNGSHQPDLPMEGGLDEAA